MSTRVAGSSPTAPEIQIQNQNGLASARRPLRGVFVFTSLPRSFLALFLSLSIYAGAQQVRRQLISRPIDESALVTLRGGTHPMARPIFDIGTAPPDLPMDRMLLVLKRDPQQDLVLHRLLDDQQDRNSPNYHKWLTPTQFGVQFGASDQDLQLITGWLQTHGFQINRVSNGRTVIEFSGMESQVEQAFHTQIHRYAIASGEQHWANATDPRVPAALLPAVAGVWSLHDFRKQPKTRILKSQISIPAKGSSPLLTFQGQHALMPGDLATIYNLNPLYSQGINGQGSTIAVVARSSFYTPDLYDFHTLAGIPGVNLNVITDGPGPGIFDQNEEAEALLDTTWSSAIAPNAQINFVVSASTNTTDGVDLSELYIVDNNAGDVMTESFGSCEGFATQAEAQALSALAEQAAAEGITYMVSSGDSGAEGCVRPSSSSAGGAQVSVNVLASPPYVVAVGGTMFNDVSNSSAYWNSTNNPNNLSSAKSYIPENVWNESCLGNCGLWAGGGGASTFFPKPNWQFGVSGIPNDGHRDLPDVSLTAAGHDPYLLCFEGSCEQNPSYLVGIGGTSASAPSFAGIMGLVVQLYGRQGLANYILYRLAASETLSQCNGSKTTGLPASTCIFNDVTVGNNAVPGEAGFGTAAALYQAGIGYDLAVGLGSVNASNLVTQWKTVTFNATNTTLGPGTITGVHGTPASLNISVAPSSGTGVPTGDVSLQTDLNTPKSVGFLTLNNGSVATPVSDLPGGTYTLSARYGGDATYAPSTSNGISVNISPESSNTVASVLTADPFGNPIPFTSGQYGGFLYLRADVAGQSGIGIPTGGVNFYDNGALVGNAFSYMNSEAQAAFPYPWFSVGQHSLTASYIGDFSFSPSTSSAVTFSIAPATTTTSVVAQTPTSVQGSSVTLNLSVHSPAFAGQSSGGYPSGNVTLWNGNTQIGTAQLVGIVIDQSGVTSLTGATVTLPAGINSVTAQYAGDSNFLPSVSTPISVTIVADFTFAPANASVSVAQGGSVSNSLTITGQSGYNNTINFTSASCSGLPSLTTCSFSPPSVIGSGNTIVTLKTTAPSSAALRGISFTGVGFVFAGVLLMGVPSRRLRSYAALSVVLCVLAIASVACGGGSSNDNNNLVSSPGTPKGSYPIIITAKTSDQAITHTVAFSLVVQ